MTDGPETPRLKVIDQTVCHLRRFGTGGQPAEKHRTYVLLDEVLLVLRDPHSFGQVSTPEASAETPRLRALAEAIAQRLFTNGSGQHAHRLVLTVDAPTKGDLGGWCEEAAIDQIESVLVRAGALPRNRFDCPDCGPGVAVDEEGCCRACGAEAVMVRAGAKEPEQSPAVRKAMDRFWKRCAEVDGVVAGAAPAQEPEPPTRFEKTIHGGSCGTTPFYIYPWQKPPEYDQGHFVIVWYDDLYDLALAATSAGAAPQRQTIERHLDYLREAMREALRLSKDAPDEDIIDQAGEQAEWLSNYEKHMTAIAAAAGVRLNGSECQWSDMSREVIAKLASAGAAPGEAKVPRCTECGAIVSIVHTCFPKVAAHGAGRPQIQVGCERPDGTLNIHAESETCAECHPVVSPASDPQTEKR